MRDKLRKGLEKAGLTATEASRRIGRGKDYLNDFFSGRKRSLKPDEIAELQKLFGDIQSEPRIRSVPVRGTTAAGYWLEHDDDTMQDTHANISFVGGSYENIEQFAYKIAGNSMVDARIFDGDFAICVPYFEVRSSPVSGDIVIVERRRGGLFERTCKELQVGPNSFSLLSRSPDPRYVNPIVVTKDHEADGTEVEIIGLVIYVSRPIAIRRG